MRRVVPLLLLVLLLASLAYALPEYELRYNQTCALCHVNPTGGGMRTLYGAQFFAYNDLPMHAKSFEEIQTTLPMAGNLLQYGFDLRGLYALGYGDDGLGNKVAGGSEFVLMEGDAYLDYALSDATAAVIDLSLAGVEEAFASFSAGNGKLRLRAGKFRSTYGWGWVDHTVYVRRFLDYGSLRGPGSRAYNTGLEGGFYNDLWDATVGIGNGAPGSDGNAYYTRLARRFAIQSFTATLGISGRADDLGGGHFSPYHYGAFYGANLGRFTYLGETDLRVEREPAGTKLEELHGVASTHELRYLLKRGLYLNGWYEFYDPDLDTESGYAWRTRIGLDIIPYGYISLSPVYEWNYSEPVKPDGESLGQFLIQLHLWL